MKTINIYTDGACSGNHTRENFGGFGAILEYKSNTKEIFGGEINTTNNRMEMMALLSALKALKQTDMIVNVFSDSAYLVECLNKRWYINWMNNDWTRGPSKEPVKNVDLWKELLTYLSSYAFKFFIIKGHVNLNNPKTDLSSLYHKFLESNGPDFTYEDFLYIVRMNNKADELANTGIALIKSDLAAE